MGRLACRRSFCALILLAGGAVAAAAHGGAAAAELSGTVYLPNGQPARNVRLLGTVTIYSYVEPPGKSGAPPTGRDLTRIGTSGEHQLVTDAGGRYRLGLPGPQPSESGASERVRAAYHILFWSPTGLGYAEVGRLYQGVAPGSGLDIHLQEGDRITGRVVGYPGAKPLAGIEVVAEVEVPGSRGHGRETAENAVTDKEGRFRLSTSLPPNGYLLEAKPAGWAMMETQVEPPPSKEPAARTAELRLVQPYTIRGHAYGPDGQPLRKTHLGFSVESFAARRPGLLSASFGGSEETTTDEQGAFAIPQEPRRLRYGQGPYLGHNLKLTPKPQGGMVAQPVQVDATDPATHAFDLRFAAPATVSAK